MGSFKTENFTFIDFTEMDEFMSRQVWECRNLLEIRKWMVNRNLISFDSHNTFIVNLTNSDKVLYYSVLMGGVFVGSVNIHFEEKSNSAERGLYIHPFYWGKGLAKKICKELYIYLRDNIGLTHVTTKVLKENISSNCLEHSLNAKLVKEDDVFYYYDCQLTII